MRRTRFDDWPCPIARATDLIGDWWTPLVLRNAFFGETRFEQFQTSWGVPRAVLAARLQRLCEQDMLNKVEYQTNPVRYEYRLTDKGRAFWDVLAAMWRWGSDWLWEDGTEPPVVLTNRDTKAMVRPLVVDENTGNPIPVRSIRVRRNRAGPSGRSDELGAAQPGFDRG